MFDIFREMIINAKTIGELKEIGSKIAQDELLAGRSKEYFLLKMLNERKHEILEHTPTHILLGHILDLLL